jgi:flavin-binding protein dodecin
VGSSRPQRGRDSSQDCDLRVAEVEKLDVTIENGKVTSYRARLSISFKYQTGD